MFKELETAFEKEGIESVRSRIDKGLYSGRKLKAAIAWVKKHDRVQMSHDREHKITSQRWEAIRSWIAIVISVVALAIAYIK